jgi:hypothetical protein
MVLIPVLCPHCHSDQVIKGGKTKTGKQRYKCKTQTVVIIPFCSTPRTKGAYPRSSSKSLT